MSTEKIQIEGFSHVRYRRETFDLPEVEKRTTAFYEWLDTRRTVREISDRPVSKLVIDNLIKAASTAPSGAHKQPWTFCAISNPELKRKMREAAEKEEYDSYHGRMSDRWLDDLKPMATNWHKPFIEQAPWVVVLMKKVYNLDEKGEKENNYYVNESVGIAAGMFITAIHNAGLVTLTHTPSPMNFLSKILNRPENERPFLLLPVGYPEEEVYVPDLQRKPLEEISVYYT